jgi:serine protease Do
MNFNKQKDINEKTKLSTYSTKSLKLKKLNVKLSDPRFVSAGAKRAIIGALGVFIVGMMGGWFGSYLYNDNRSLYSATTSQKQQYISNESDLIASIAKSTGQSVVSIDVSSQTLSQDFFGFTQSSDQQSAGTGFIVSSDGIIVTNRHVVPESANSVRVTLSDGTKFDEVEVIGRSASNSSLDVAFLKIKDLKGKQLVPVVIGDSETMQVGDKVVAIGNALGQFQNTVTSGILSGYGRDVQAGDRSGGSSESLSDLFQTDAAINEGNSGGPLVNINGEVIGLNTAVASGAQNIGFAIPINDVKNLIKSVVGTGKLEQPYLGVRYISLNKNISYRYNLSVDNGAYIAPSQDGTESIVTGSPAESAGLREKDIIVKVNNVQINEKNNLTSVLSKFKVGDEINLQVIRSGKNINLKATLKAIPQT